MLLWRDLSFFFPFLSLDCRLQSCMLTEYVLWLQCLVLSAHIQVLIHQCCLLHNLWFYKPWFIRLRFILWHTFCAVEQSEVCTQIALLHQWSLGINAGSITSWRTWKENPAPRIVRQNSDMLFSLSWTVQSLFEIINSPLSQSNKYRNESSDLLYSIIWAYSVALNMNQMNYNYAVFDCDSSWPPSFSYTYTQKVDHSMSQNSSNYSD